MSDLKSLRIELEHGKASEDITIRIEELVVVNRRVLAKDPLAVGPQVGLCGSAFDEIAERVLPLVGVGKIDLIGEEQNSGDQGSGDQHRHNNPVEADSGRFDRGNLVRSLE